MSCFFSKTSYERCGFSMGCGVAIASEHYLYITTLRYTPDGSRGPGDARRQDRGHCEKTPQQPDTRRGALGTPATLAAYCGARQAPWPLDAGTSLGPLRAP